MWGKISSSLSDQRDIPVDSTRVTFAYPQKENEPEGEKEKPNWSTLIEDVDVNESISFLQQYTANQHELISKEREERDQALVS
jgi:hypothetical protein